MTHTPASMPCSTVSSALTILASSIAAEIKPVIDTMSRCLHNPLPRDSEHHKQLDRLRVQSDPLPDYIRHPEKPTEWNTDLHL